MAQADLEGLQDLVNDIPDVDRFELICLPSGFDLGKVEDVVDQLGQAAALGLDVLAILLDLVRLLDTSEPQELAEHADGGERRAQLVSDVRDEIRFHLGQLHLMGGGPQGDEDAADQDQRQERRERHVDCEV